MATVTRQVASVLPFSTEQFYLSEGPYVLSNPNSWNSGTIFSFVNIQTGHDQPGQLHIVNTSNWTHKVHDLPEPVGFAFPTNEDNKFVVGLGKGLAIYDANTKKVTKLVEDLKEGDTLVNDALLVNEGLVFGSKHLKTPQKLAGLWYYSYANRTPLLLMPNLKISNGMDTITDEKGQLWLVHTDTPDLQIKKYPFDPKTGKFDRQQGKVIVDLTDAKAGPDGLTLTPDKKHLIVALWNDDEDATEGQARQYNLETGKLERIFVVPGAPRVTCPILVKDKVILTTAWEGSLKLKKAQPNSGRVFVADTKGNGFDFGDIPESQRFLTAKL